MHAAMATAACAMAMFSMSIEPIRNEAEPCLFCGKVKRAFDSQGRFQATSGSGEAVQAWQRIVKTLIDLIIDVLMLSINQASNHHVFARNHC
jgi:hypothetical protein